MSSIQRPPVVWIEGRCYRIDDPNTEISSLQEHDLYENETILEDVGDDDSDDNFEIIEIGSNRYAASLHVSTHYFGSIIGKKGIIRSRIERDTRTTIKIPRMGETGDINVLGPSRTNVKAACRRINMIVMASRMKRRPTHFLSIPLNDPIIMKNFEDFKQHVLQEIKGIDESLFIDAKKLHITIGVMCLMDNEERLHASKLLSEARENILMPLLQEKLPLKIRLKGLSYMNDDPKNINILYGNVEDEAGTDIIQTIADALVDFFYKAGFIDKHEYGRDKVKLHVTLLKSVYKNRSSLTDEAANDVGRARRTFDGSEVLKMFADYDFGVTEVNNIHLSQLKTKGTDGYYQPTFVVSLNKN